jgi:hypothetical protein
LNSVHKLTRAVVIVAVAVLSITLVRSTGVAQSPRDRRVAGDFGGIAVSVGAPTGAFRVTKIGNRWIWVSPDGMAFWSFGVYNINASDSLDDRGGRYRARVTTKYGDADLSWAPQQLRRLKSWGFNAIGEYSSNYTLPWATISDPRWPGGSQPVKMPAVPFPLQAAWYSQTNLRNYARGPVKELYWALGKNFRGYRGQFPDLFDPNFDAWIAGRLTDNEYVQAAASPWLLGFGSDDTDYLTGFGPGADFDSGGKAHPHLGFVTLLTPPTQSANPARNVTYTDTKVYIKHALRDFLRTKYGSLEALNAAWSARYTTFDSDGGWPNGSGFLDEAGRGTWVGTDPTVLRDARPAVRADLDAFLYEIAKKYFSTYRAQIKRAYPHVLYLGSTTIGGWGAPPRRQILQAAGQYVDVIRTTYNGEPARLDFIAQHAGDKPIMTWLGAVANPDSAFFRHPNGGQSNMFATQAERGQYYATSVTTYVDAVAKPTGAKPFIGIQWWEFLDNAGEKANWGLVTLSDNAYDGFEAMKATRRNSAGLPVGGEERDSGDFISKVRETNLGLRERLREELETARRR